MDAAIPKPTQSESRGRHAKQVADENLGAGHVHAAREWMHHPVHATPPTRGLEKPLRKDVTRRIDSIGKAIPERLCKKSVFAISSSSS